jgi:hypothetical protein
MAFDKYTLKSEVAAKMWRQANRGTWDGRGVRSAQDYRAIGTKPYFDRCIGAHEPTGTILIFTRDEGMHSSGWWKNPDYERCLHLSLSFRDRLTGSCVPRDVQLSKEWVEAFFHEHQRLIWAEPPYTDEGRDSEVWHYRVFCDLNWCPMLPRKEVYTRDFTETGWKSFSELGFDPHPALPER